MARARSFDVRRQAGFPLIAITCFVLLYLPIILLVVYSFNAGRSIAIWEGFSLQWYVSAWENEKVQDATIRSLIIATCASLIATSAATPRAPPRSVQQPINRWSPCHRTFCQVRSPTMPIA